MTISKLETTTPIKSSPDKLYGFFKNDMNDLVNIFPANFKSVQLIEGEDGKVGNIKLWSYVLGGITESVKVKTEVIDDSTRTITFNALEGNVLLLYKSFRFTLSVSEVSCNWSIEYEKILAITPPPDLYIAFAVAVTEVVDLYLLSL